MLADIRTYDTLAAWPSPPLVDTAGWMACADAADPAHLRACAARDRALEDGLTLVTTDFIVDETLRSHPARLDPDATAARGSTSTPSRPNGRATGGICR